jgi:4-hydroxybenzoate polyprenyltransferase
MTADSQTVNKKPIAIKFIALLSIVRWYNILLIIFAQYLFAFVLMRPQENTFWIVLSDIKLHAIVLASIFSIAAGFIINNFYDFEKDLINRPQTTLFNKWVSKQSTLNFYIGFNCISLLIAFSASFKIGLFFLGFIAGLWVYSHKLQRMPFIKELAASVLSIACFFAVLLHYSKFHPFIFVFGAFYMSIVYSRELIKQFINYNGDLALNVQSIPVSIGLDKAKSFSVFVIVLSILGGLAILIHDGLVLRTYFIVLALSLSVGILYLIQKDQFKIINTLYKVLLILGILNIFWIQF